MIIYDKINTIKGNLADEISSVFLFLKKEVILDDQNRTH